MSTLSSTDSHPNLFNHTMGRWVYNETLWQEERRLPFDVDELLRLAAESVNQGFADVVSISKLAEGGFNRVFLVTLRDGQQVIARVPYPATVPKYHAVASEVATIEYMRSSGLPVPTIYGYSADSDNAARTPYILMELVQGTTLGSVWRGLSDQEVVSVVRQLTELESRMMSLPFPAGGSLYFTKDLEKVGAGLGIPLEDPRFCVGPDTRVPLWFGRRAKLDVDRGPYRSAEAALMATAGKEMAYLTQFGQPILPFRRQRRFGYQNRPQSPLSHVENLERFIEIAPFLLPKDPAQSRFCIRHPDLRYDNIIVARSPDTGCEIVSLIDWQHASILPMFLLAGVPQQLQSHDDNISQSTTPLYRPENLEALSEGERDQQEYVYRQRVVNYHYHTSTEQCNQRHYTALTDPLHALRGRLFAQAGAPWEGETLELKLSLIQATEKWTELVEDGVPCPIAFEAEDVRATVALDEALAIGDLGFNAVQDAGNIREEGWVLSEDYEDAVAFLQDQKQQALANASAEECEEIHAHWPWDDMDEEGYM